MLGSCCACAKAAPTHSAVTRTARCALPVELGMGRYNHRNATNDRRAVARERHGLFRCGASAAARVRRPSIQNIRERYSDHVPPGPNIWTLNIQPLGQFRPHSAFCQPDPHCLAVWPVCYIPPGKLPVCFDDLQMHNSM
jgi:hypothetical protein